ncbi:MAG: helix-turn-helix transcriptional regulator [Specibacter sp.]
MGLSPSQLRRYVQKAAGIGPKEFVVQMRMSRSQSLLAESSYPIERIARLVGYRDPAYFSRLFSQCTGSSPSNFRTQHFRAEPST